MGSRALVGKRNDRARSPAACVFAHAAIWNCRTLWLVCHKRLAWGCQACGFRSVCECGNMVFGGEGKDLQGSKLNEVPAPQRLLR